MNKSIEQFRNHCSPNEFVACEKRQGSSETIRSGLCSMRLYVCESVMLNNLVHAVARQKKQRLQPSMSASLSSYERETNAHVIA